ncbi:MAG: 50S ribosomal protein L11 [Patescibacteria group bacterium]
MAKIKAKVKIQIQAGKATPAPPIGPALAPHGINLSDFCQQFNDKTRDMEGNVVPADVIIYEDRTFSFVLKQPLVSHMIKKSIGIEKGSGFQKKTKVGKITKAQIREIAEKKMPDLNTKDIEAAMRTVEGTANAMGVEVVD